MKRNMPLSKIIGKDIPEIAAIIEYSRGLKYDERPDYRYIRRSLKSLLIKSGANFDFLYDWTLFCYSPEVLEKQKIELKRTMILSETNISQLA
jgi:hypothetical protein